MPTAWRSRRRTGKAAVAFPLESTQITAISTTAKTKKHHKIVNISPFQPQQQHENLHGFECNHTKLTRGKPKQKKMKIKKSLGCQEEKNFPDNKGATGGFSSPLEILPEEVWLLIFQQTHPKDLRNCHNTCIEWTNLLKSKRTKFLFLEVLPIIATNLNRNGILNCRLVCQSWKDSVDHFLQNHSSHYKLALGSFTIKDKTEAHFEQLLTYHKSPIRPLHDRLLTNPNPNPHSNFYGNIDFCGFESSLAILKFLQKMEHHTAQQNPFMMRRVLLQDSMFPAIDESLQMWNMDVPSLLHKFGQHIWFCKLSITCRHSPTTTYKILKQTLSQMPNLKTLEISYNGVRHLNREMIQLKDVIRAYPLPKLEHLVQLKIEQMPYPMINEIFTKLNSICRMRMSRVVEQENPYDFDHKIQLLNLRQMYIHLQSLADVVQFGRVCWPLEDLTVEYFNISGQTADLQKTFHVLSSFSKTLQRLNLIIHQELDEFNKKRRLKLNLPNLESLNLSINDYTSLDFLECLSSLQKLTIILEDNELGKIRWDDVKAKIKFYSCWDSMYNSSIWSILPKLKTIHVYVRERNFWGRGDNYAECRYSRDRYIIQNAKTL